MREVNPGLIGTGEVALPPGCGLRGPAIKLGRDLGSQGHGPSGKAHPRPSDGASGAALNQFAQVTDAVD